MSSQTRQFCSLSRFPIVCVAVINSPNNGQARAPLQKARDSVSGGWESDLISINCEWPAGALGPHMFFLAAVSQRARRGAFAETARCTDLL